MVLWQPEVPCNGKMSLPLQVGNCDKIGFHHLIRNSAELKKTYPHTQTA